MSVYLVAALIAAVAPAAGAAQSIPAVPAPVAAPTPATQPLSTVIFKSDPRYKAFGPAGPYYPDRAARLHRGGLAVLQCSADSQGVLSGCAVERESPPDLAFGGAAIAMAKSGWMKLATPPDPAQATPDGRVRVEVDFPPVGDVRLP